MDSIIMPGVTIGEGSIIGVGSLVTEDIPDWCVAVGRPAKVVKRLKSRCDENVPNMVSAAECKDVYK